MLYDSNSKKIQWWEPQVGKEEKQLLLDVLNSNFLNDGEFTTRFETHLAKLLNCKHAVAVTSGTSALFLALVANGIGHGDEVLVPDIACEHFATTYVFKHAFNNQNEVIFG